MGRVLAGFAITILGLPLLVAWYTGVPDPGLIVGLFTVTGGLLGGGLLWVFVRRGWLGLWPCALAGGAIGVLCCGWLLLMEPLAWLLDSPAVPLLADLGALHATLFWFIAVRGNRRLARTGSHAAGVTTG